MNYTNFCFKDYSFDSSKKTLSLCYTFDNEISYCEKFVFDFDFTNDLDLNALDRAFQTLFFLAGISYYKAYPSQNIAIEKGSIDKNTAKFLGNTYSKGLGEFFYLNQLDPKAGITFPVNSSDITQAKHLENSGLLVGIGGGKDSIVSVELLRDQPKVATWSLGHRNQITPLVQQIGLEHFWVERTIDPLLIEQNTQGARNGHIPISAILSAVGVVVAILSGYRDVIVSNESSANEPTLEYQGVQVNHQYSKSSQYELEFQSRLQAYYGNDVRYYSFLRPFSEVKISKIFAKIGFNKYKDTFSSCNRAFVLSSNHMSWCGKCSKCAFTFLALTPFVNRPELESLFGDKNLLLEPALELTYRNLLGISGEKPLDCVGEIKESRQAMDLAKNIYPDLKSKYSYDLPSSYSYESLGPHHMPEEMYSLFKPVLKSA